MFFELFDPNVCLVVFCGKDSESRGLRNKLDAARGGAEVEAIFEVEEGFRDNPVARAREKESKSSRFGLDNRKGGSGKLSNEC